MTQANGFQPGDILVACDNELNVPTGILGHAAIVVSPTQIVEAVITYPYVQLSVIESFRRIHPKHAVYRPNTPKLGEAAAQFAVWYLQQSNAYKKQGYNVPPFSFSSAIPLQDAWTSTYCSKLVWLSYFYGAGISFYNDFYLFTPEDLDTGLKNDPQFTLLYKHPEFQFLINT
ncbi:hypothetical protein [Paenibacillus turpanensis]|uniref:hypothetical protein n=1 Tax=Paenibacillus turpanensis TaxID=2689078 RepID=UPI001408054A|nr:hypothetical protein [Paenibacillus turpanensis]